MTSETDVFTLEQISFAPMEGVTGRTFRKIHREFFPGTDRYYSPFLSANQNHHFKHRDKKEFIPYEPDLIPQIMASKPEDFIWAAKTIADEGYNEVNLNLGCPVATVVTKKKGAGLLADTEALLRLLDGIFTADDMPAVSAKTRIGFTDPSEAGQLGEIYARFPFSEIIIHPRIRADFYKNKPDLKAFNNMKEKLSCRICYNGDINTPEDAKNICRMFPDIHRIMIGRGLVANPALAREIRMKEQQKPYKGLTEKELSDYLKALWNAYSEIYSGERDVLFKMKEMWSYLGALFPDASKELDKVRKSKNAEEYREHVKRILSTGRS
ncbi:MAG: tRNA-dihydrouridine synthase family protein [Lachnospiraceae bacterium]|nr:tRNA-dihydrouridine synthase family protein [Lachnospiraceae bacterium]